MTILVIPWNAARRVDGLPPTGGRLVPPALSVGADYGLTVMNGATPPAQAFARFIVSADSQKIMTGHGFTAK